MERFLPKVLPRAVAVLGVWALTHGSASAQGERIYTYDRTTAPLVLIVDELNSKIIITSFCQEGLFEVDWIREGKMGGPELLEFRSTATTTTAEGRPGTSRPQLLMEPRPDAGAQRRVRNIFPDEYLLYFDPDNNLERVGRIGWESLSLICPGSDADKDTPMKEINDVITEMERLKRVGAFNADGETAYEYYRELRQRRLQELAS